MKKCKKKIWYDCDSRQFDSLTKNTKEASDNFSKYESKGNTKIAVCGANKYSFSEKRPQ